MSGTFNDPYSDNLIGLWDFLNGSETHDTGLADGYAQNGALEGGASISGGRLHTDGHGDYFDVSGNDDPFDLTTGTIAVQFTQDAHVGSSPDVIVNRGEYADMNDEGWFGIKVTQDGKVISQHCPIGPDGARIDAWIETPAGFFSPGDTVKVTYAWDAATGATLNVVNTSTGETFEGTVDVAGLTLDIGDNDDESFTFGAREEDDGRYDQFFNGSIDYVAIYDIDVNNPPAPALDGIVQGTDGNDLIDINYGNDPQGDMIDSGDAVLPGEGAQDDIILAGEGNDFVLAGDGDDDVFGGEGDDTLCGQDGDDLLVGGAGNDLLEGMVGDDTANGGNGNDRIYGDQGDDCLAGGAGDDIVDGGIGNDTLDGGAGNDKLTGGTGADAIYAGSGDDTVSGGAGDDVIYGDSSKEGVNGGEVVRESFEWDQASGSDLWMFTQNTGNVNVTFTTEHESGASETQLGTDTQNVSDIDGDGTPVDDDSSLDNVLNGQGNQADYSLGFDQDVANVSFRINDIDGDGVVKVTAYDADGNKVHIDLQTGNNLTLLDTDEIAGGDTADSQGGYAEDTNPAYSLLVSIPGPITRIEIAHDQDGSNNSGINITDVYFDVETVDNGADGDDSLAGGAGDDSIFGEGGNDTIDGGIGADDISGGDDRDVILGGAGDTVDGGAGGDDYDILDLTGQGPFYLDDVVTDSNGNGIDGTVVFVDADGAPTGDTIFFTEIEEVRGDNVGQPPAAMDDSATVDEDGSVIINVLENDSDPDGDPLTVTEADSPNGDVTINPDGTITFEPAPDFNGETTITYTVTDPDGNEDTATVTVTVTPVNDDPVANDDSDSTLEDTPVTIPLLDNDTDVDGDDLTVTEATSPDGTVEINPDGTITFTPNEDFTGPATISYTVSDGNGGEDSATVTVDVTPVADAPVAMDDTAETDEDTPVVIDVLENDSDPDGDPLTVTEADSPNGGVTINPDGTLEFTPDPDFNGETTITYTVTDPDGNEDTATVTVTVNPVNDAPVAMDDTASTPEDTAVTIPVLENDTDVDGDPLTVVDATSPDGDVTINPDGTLEFTPNPGFTGPATITYTVEDPDGLQDDATVTVNVTNVNEAPVATDDTDATLSETAVVVDALANDSDPDGDPLSIVEATVPADQGTVEIVDNKIAFTPAPGFEGVAEVAYTIEDPDGLQDDAVVTINVRNGIVNGTDAGDLIDVDYADDPGGDVVDGNDAVLPGEAPNDDIIEAGDGDDTVLAGFGDDEIYGGAGDDEILGGDGNDDIFGGEGNDVINSSRDEPFDPGRIDQSYPGIYDGEGDPDDDPALVSDDLDFVDGGAGDDTISTGDDDDTIIGGTGNDVIDGGIDDDLIDGGEGDDRIVGSEGNDTIDGGTGNDTIYAGADPALIPDAVNITDDGFDSPIGPDLVPFNGLDVVHGGEGDDVIFGADDRDMLYGDEGDDYIDGGIDEDFIDGGTGNDTLLGGHGGDTILGGDGNDYIDGGRNRDLIDGGDGDDTILGGNGADVIDGGDGDDFIDGGTGDDELSGGAGNDTITGATGDDEIDGGDGDDLIDGGNGGNDTLRGGADRDTFVNVDAGETVDGGSGGFNADPNLNTDYDVLDLTGSAPANGSLEVTFTGADSNGNGQDGFVTYFDADGNETGTLEFTEIEEVVPCFTPGTLIATPRGEVPVDEVQVGDRVITRDNGIQEIRWVGQRAMTGAELARASHMMPIMIRQGALGNNLPERDMMVSPNHRVLVANDKTALYFEEREVLVAAKHLVGLAGVEIADVNWVTYIHVMFDQHEVILSDGAWSESFQPGDMTLGSMGNAQRNEILELFPELKTRAGIEGYTAARRSLKKHEAQLLKY